MGLCFFQAPQIFNLSLPAPLFEVSDVASRLHVRFRGVSERVRTCGECRLSALLHGW